MYRISGLRCLRSNNYTFMANLTQTRITAPTKPSPDTAAPHNLFERSRRVRTQARKNNTHRNTTSSDSRSSGAEKSYGQRAAGVLSSGQDAIPAMHLYANKESAWRDYTDDPHYGRRRLREYWQKLRRDRAAYYYVLATLILIVGTGAKLHQVQRRLVSEEGLVGPKRRSFRSRLTVVLDVDETIVSYGDKAFRLHSGLVPRPYLAELLDYLSSIDAEVILWSGCSDRYMRQVLGVIDPAGVRVSRYITRSRDWFVEDNYYEKNIAWLKRPPEDTLIIENRPLSVRNCNANALLVDDFIRAEYMDNHQDYPMNDHALLTVKHIIEDLETSGMPVPQYLASKSRRNAEIHAIPCHLAIHQLPDELARGVFYFVGNKYVRGEMADEDEEEDKADKKSHA